MSLSPKDGGGLQFHWTVDRERVRRMICDPRAWRRMANDSAPPREEFTVRPGLPMSFVVAREDGFDKACFFIIDDTPDSRKTAELHVVFAPETWGDTRRITKAFVAWVWTATPYHKLLAPIPEYNRLALKLALDAGFRRTGQTFDSGMRRRGRPFQCICTEIEKPL